MGALIYPKRELWKPRPFWQRWRNPTGERIRLSGGGPRMHDDECCCCGYCDAGSLGATMTVTIAGFANLPWTGLNGTWILSKFDTCHYSHVDSSLDPCSTTFGSVGACVVAFIDSGLLRVALRGSFTSSSGSPASIYGTWHWRKTFASSVDCTGTHSLTIYGAGNGSFAPAFLCVGGFVSPPVGTSFYDCDGNLQTETPSCSVTF